MKFSGKGVLVRMRLITLVCEGCSLVALSVFRRIMQRITLFGCNIVTSCKNEIKLNFSFVFHLI